LITTTLQQNNMKYEFPKFKNNLRAHLIEVYCSQSGVDESKKKLSPDLQALYWNLEYKMSEGNEYSVSKFDKFEPQKIRLLKERRTLSANRPSFHRYLSIQYNRLAPAWRRPKGLQNKLRRALKDKGTLVKIGFSSPREVSGLNEKGYDEAVVCCQRDLVQTLNLNPMIYMVLLSSKLGLKKSISFENQLFKKGFFVKNAVVLHSKI
jgi:large subunit ribosomal protein L32e